MTIIDPLMFCERDGHPVVLTTALERSRIERALPGAEVLDFFAFGLRELRQGGASPEEATREVAVRVARHIELREAFVPGDFPVALADRLREDGVELVIDDRAVQFRRRRKRAPSSTGSGPRSGRPRRE